MVTDCSTKRATATAAISSPDEGSRGLDVRSRFSEAEMRRQEKELKAFLHERMYDSPRVKAVKDEAQAVLTALFAAYRDDPARLPPEWRPAAVDTQTILRAIGDFIAGMTDRYAIRRHQELVGPVGLPEGF